MPSFSDLSLDVLAESTPREPWRAYFIVQPRNSSSLVFPSYKGLKIKS